MNDENKWSDMSNDNGKISKKVISNMGEENLINDLKDNFKITIDNTFQLIDNIVKTLDASVTNEEIKEETKEIITNVNFELNKLLKKTKYKFSEVFDTDLISEEE